MIEDGMKSRKERFEEEDYSQFADQVRADNAYAAEHRPSYRTDIRLPYDFCIKVGVRAGYSAERVEELLIRHFDAFKVPMLDSFLWGWPDNECAYGDERHAALISAGGELVRSPWVREAVDYVLCQEPGAPTDDLLGYSLYVEKAIHGSPI